MIIKDLIDILTHRIPTIVFMSVYVGGIVGVVSLAIHPREWNKKYLYISLSIVGLMILERAFFYSNMVSKRYFEIFLIPFIIFSACGCNIVRELFTLFRFEKRISPNIFSLISVVLLIVIIAVETGKLLRVDFYRLNILQAISEYSTGKDAANEIIIFTNFNMEEIHRIKHYLKSENKVVKHFDIDAPYDIYNVPNILCFKNIVFLIESDLHSSNNSPGNIFQDMTFRKNVSKVYTSHKRKEAVFCFSYLSQSDKTGLKDPIFHKGKNTYNILNNDLIVKRAELISSDAGKVITGQNSQIFSKDFIPVPELNRIDLTASIKNVGSNSTKISVGYVYYDKDKKMLGAEFYPENNKNTILTVISANESSIIVDKYPEWHKKNAVAINAMEDLSDIPNTNILNGVVANVESVSPETNTITLTKPLQENIAPGTKIRLQRVSGAYIYTNKKNMSPNSVFFCESSIAKYDSYPCYNSKAISKGVYYVKPVILSYSSDTNKNSIELLQWELVY